MEKILTVYKNELGYIYFIDSLIDVSEDPFFEADYIMSWETSEVFFNTVSKYQNEGYTIIFAKQK